MNVPILHFPHSKLGTFLFAEPGTMLWIAGLVLLAAVCVGYFLYTESRKESKSWGKGAKPRKALPIEWW